jgi:FixJ family two-component response regulator
MSHEAASAFHCKQMKENGQSSGLMLVLVDNDMAVRSSLMFSLGLEGFAVRSYATAGEVLDATDLASCSCLVIEEKLPGSSGLDLISKLRARHVAVPAILVTSNPSLSVRQRAHQFKVPIVEKPLLGNALLDEINQVVRHTRD